MVKKATGDGSKEGQVSNFLQPLPGLLVSVSVYACVSLLSVYLEVLCLFSLSFVCVSLLSVCFMSVFLSLLFFIFLFNYFFCDLYFVFSALTFHLQVMILSVHSFIFLYFYVLYFFLLFSSIFCLSVCSPCLSLLSIIFIYLSGPKSKPEVFASDNFNS